ncbi:MAG: DUF2764 family protein [Anaerolineales bacterium]|nr:DUF2764 family protein [Anaerolineales bacterium]
MPGYYTYLISSLPMLNFGAKPPFSFEQFLRICQRVIPESDIGILKQASITGEYSYQSNQPTLKKWHAFDTVLRNELAKIRAARKRVDPLKYLRADVYADPSVTRIALNAYRNPSILEAERMLDQERWHVLEEGACGHYFDIDFLIVYAHKILILERWEKIDTADKTQRLEEVLK